MASRFGRLPCRARAYLLAVAAFLCAMAFVSLAACTAGRESARDVLVFGRNKDALTLDPAVAFDGMSLTVTHEIYEGLTRYRPGTFEVEPSLATSWTASRDGTKWLFHLRHGVLFQDGTPFDAKSVKFNFDRWRLPANAFHAGGNYIYWESQFGGFPGRVNAVRVIAPDLVEIDLTQPLAPLLANLAMPAFGIASPTALRRERSNFARTPVGTGPYQLEEWVKDDHITLRRFDRYWGRAARIETVILRDIPDAAATVLSLEKGDIDGWEFPTPGSLDAIRDNRRLTTYHGPPNSAMWLRINVTKAPFDDVRVRRAVAMAIDRKAIVRNFFDPSATIANELLPGAVWPHGVEVASPYDPAAARAELALAGYRDRLATSLVYPTVPRPYLPEPQRVAEAVQSDLRTIGIDAKLEGLEWAVYLKRVESGDDNLAVGGWTGDNGDPDNFLYSSLDEDAAHAPGASNSSFWRNHQYHRLMMTGQREDDRVKRADAYRRALALVREDVPLVPIAHTRSPIVFRSAVRGFVPSPDSMISFQDLYFSEK